ncbi:MAG: hypothetical protein IJ456_09300 [Bacteroides sp.]|nr:hypothetical protein [Bacteroides sp.]
MLDFDEKGHSQEILEKALQLNEQGKWEILLVEESVRKGTHVLITLPARMSPQEAQVRFSEDVGFQADPALKDIARCIYMVPADYTLFVSDALFNPSSLVIPPSPLVILNEVKDLNTSTNIPVMSFRAEQSEAKNLGNINVDENEILPPYGRLNDNNNVRGGFPQTYNDIPYTQIVETLEEQMGGRPEHGSRNNFIFSMACHLRYVCNDDPDWIATVLPTYGEGREKWMHSIRSACARNQTQLMPRIMRRTLSICKQILRHSVPQNESQGDTQVSTSDANPPKMPDKLPPIIELLVSRTPDIYKPAVAHAVFPPLAAHLWKTYFRYIDNVPHEATLMNVLMAGTGAGKNCISEPINRILADIRRRDRENMYREKAWKKEMQSTGANKNKRQRPEGLVIQEIDPDMTNAAFVQRLADAEERFLYTKMNEIDQFDALKTAANRKSQFQIMCLAFDPGNVYGQTRIGTGSVTERVCIRFNWNASTTIHKGKTYFRALLTDGPISRINFCTIPEREIGAQMPVYGSYDDAFDRELSTYIDRLNAARGEVECPEAFALAKQLSEECAEFARLSQSRVYENLSFRANVIAYLKAMVLYVAHGYWDATMEEFVRWSLKYDMWCKMVFFGNEIDMQEENAKLPTKGPQNLLDQLPLIFTREEAGLMRKRLDIRNGSLKLMLSNWKQRGYIEIYGEELPIQNIDRQRYTKTEKYLKTH